MTVLAGVTRRFYKTAGYLTLLIDMNSECGRSTRISQNLMRTMGEGCKGLRVISIHGVVFR